MYVEEARCGCDHRRHIKDGQDVGTVMPFIHLQSLVKCFCCCHLVVLMPNCETKQDCTVIGLQFVSQNQAGTKA